MLKIQTNQNKLFFKKTGYTSFLRESKGIQKIKQRPSFRILKKDRSYEDAIELETSFISLEENAKKITSELISRLRGGLTEIAEVPT